MTEKLLTGTLSLNTTNQSTNIQFTEIEMLEEEGIGFIGATEFFIRYHANEQSKKLSLEQMVFRFLSEIFANRESFYFHSSDR